MESTYGRGMEQAILGPLEHLMTSWWLYAALFGICAFDALVPVFPSEAPVIMAGVYAASTPDGPNALLVLIASGLGACLGDHMSYGLGHLVVGQRMLHKNPKREALVHKVQHILHSRGTWALLVVRFIPGGRSVATLSLGATRYPLLSKFTPYDLLACMAWALHGVVIGYIGGRAFQGNPVAGLVTGLGMAIVIAGLLEWRRHHKEKRAAVRGQTQPAGDADGCERTAHREDVEQTPSYSGRNAS